MGSFKYPKTFLDKGYSLLFGKQAYLFWGFFFIVLFTLGYIFIVCNSGREISFINYKIDLNARLEKPFIVEYWNNHYLNNRWDQNNENTYIGLEDSDDEFLFNDSENIVNGNVNDSQLATKRIDEVKNNKYIFGTNSEGRDLFTNLFLGLEIYLIGGFIALLTALVFGTFLASAANYSSITIIRYLARFFEDIITGYPKIVILFIVIIVFDIQLIPIMVSIGLISSTKISKALGEKINYLKKHEFIDSAKQIGLSDTNILVRHILFYNCRDIFIVYSVYILADVILLESTLAYLNFGIEWKEYFSEISVKSWGTYLAEGKSYLANGAYWITLFPALFIVIIIFSLNLIGDGLKMRYHLK